MKKDEKENKMRREIEDEFDEKIKSLTEKLNEEKKAKLEQVKMMISTVFIYF